MPWTRIKTSISVTRAFEQLQFDHLDKKGKSLLAGFNKAGIVGWEVASCNGVRGRRINHSTKQESCESEVSAELPRYPLHRTFLFTGEERRMKEEWGGSIGTWRDESIFPVLPHFCVLD